MLTAASIALLGGPLQAVGTLSILIAHEMGHYLACRYYRVDATLPFLIPSPWIPLGPGLWGPLSPFGTFGAVIRIRSRIPHRRALFDIGIAGPLAGFAVCLPVLVLGIQEARWIPNDSALGGRLLGDPLLLQWAVSWIKGTAPSDSTLVIGPLGEAAWFGLLVTALNLMPIGQLDGGHVTYALLGARAGRVFEAAWWVCVVLIYFSPSWVVWSVLLRVLGRRHPPTRDDAAPVGRGRVAVGIVGLLVLVVCFLPDPFPGSWALLRELLGWPAPPS